jgi:hypothetical protein
MKNTPFIEDRAGNCALCGLFRRRLVRDHIVPRHKGGLNIRGNIQLICANCHQDKTEDELRSHYANRPFSFQHRTRITAAQRGRHKPAEQRAKISAALMGHPQAPHTPEAREKIRLAKLGTHHSDETKAKISAALKARNVLRHEACQ